ncbi:MAG TPA: hypothetical protein VJC18_04580 [bacterium]|nr:hypothetical protein [bacterium]
MKKKNKPKSTDFDQDFDDGKIAVDFSEGVLTKGLSHLVTLPPLTIPSWLNAELERIAQLQANTKTAVVRQLLVEALLAKKGVSPV